MNDKRDGDDKKQGRGPRGPGGPGRFSRSGPGGGGAARGGAPRREGGRDETKGGERTFSAKRPFKPRFEKPEGGGRGGPRAERPAFDKSRSDRPRSDRSSPDRPRPDRPRSDEARLERPKSDAPRPERPRREPSAGAEESGGPMRIAKRLARAGIASRRDAEGMIADGRVRLNGHLVETPATVVKPSDRIEIDGEPLPATERTRLWLYHKPAGLVTTNRDPEGRPTVFDRLPDDLPRVLTIGRLDINTEGLLLLTNDGGLSRTLELPSTGWLRRYRVRAHGTVSQAQLDELRNGIAVDGVFYGAIEATLDSEKGANVWMTLGLREGKNREVKRILGHLGLDVNRLIRLSFGPFQLGELPEGAVKEIKGRTLRDQLGERLIEESGADFDAPIVNPFSNEVVEAGAKRREEPAAEARPARSEWVTAKGDGKPAGKSAGKSAGRPSHKEFGMAKRESALSRLDTKPRREGPPRDRAAGGGEDRPRGPKRFEKREERPEDDRPARPKPGGRRSANVWIAPGGRPLSERQAAEKRDRDERIRAEGAGEKPLRSRGFRDAPAGASSGDGDKPRRSTGFRDAAPGKSFGNGDRKGGFEKKAGFEKRGDRPAFDKRPPKRDGEGAGARPRAGGPGAGGRPGAGSRPGGGGGAGRRPPRDKA